MRDVLLPRRSIHVVPLSGYDTFPYGEFYILRQARGINLNPPCPFTVNNQPSLEILQIHRFSTCAAGTSFHSSVAYDGGDGC